MSYLTFLIIFLVIPLALLGLLNLRDRGHLSISRTWSARSSWLVGTIILVALLYTTPWDNYLVAQRVWWYDPTLVMGVTLGWVPLEEYLFFILQTLLGSFWFLLLARRLESRADSPRAGIPILVLVAMCALIWIFALGLLLSGFKPGNYMALELVWALPPLTLQLAWGADILWRHRRLVVSALVSLIVYLCAADTIAIQSGTWVINPVLSLAGIRVGILPVEEVIFFTVTNLLIVFGLVLGLDRESRERFVTIKKRLTARARVGQEDAA